MTDDQQLIEDILRGDKNAFRHLVERYQRPVFSIVRQLVNDAHSAEDITQEVFLSAYEKLASHDADRSEFSTWLFTIARNKSLNFIRKKKCAFQSFDKEATPADPSDDLCRQEFFAKVNQALDRLPGRQRRAFVLAELENLPYEKIAQIECTTLGTVRSRIHRAKEKLQEVMKQLSEGQK